MQTFFVDVVVPLPLNTLYTYRVPFSLNDNISIGKRILVPFGSKKILTGIIINIHQTPPSEYEAKYIHYIIDDTPCINPLQIKFWNWIASYYMCSLGEVMNAALPSGMKISSETGIILHKESDIDYTELNNEEFLITQALEHAEKLSFKEVADILENKKVIPTIQRLLKKQIALLEEEVIYHYKPKLSYCIALDINYQNDEAIKLLFEKLSRAHKQTEVLLAYLSQTKKENIPFGFINKKNITKQVEGSNAAINALIEKEILKQTIIQESRISIYQGHLQPPSELNETQKNALSSIKSQFNEKDIVLLHGVTSCGKTEIYIHLINQIISQGKQVLYLLPEIALTSQIIQRLQKIFGDQVGIYHSKFNDNERVEIYESLISPISSNHKPKIILGARSAIFLPFDNLGLIIVDEEHEISFKQFDPAPRYHARDAAIILGQIHGAKTLLGTATPAIESYYNAKKGKFGLVTITERYGNIQLPEILVADLKQAYQQKKMHSHFSMQLINQISNALNNREQIILFQNRRGFAPHIECVTCGWTPICKHCNVTLTYHKKANSLKCHYCGYIIPIPQICPSCSSNEIKFSGFGTEKIEEEIAIFFPEAKIARMDYDTTRQKDAYDRIIDDFENQKIDILIGTQMISKGLDFDNVSLVSILNADNQLFFPDFRSFERSYQLMAQVSGRAGRKNKRGTVIIQSFSPQHPVLDHVIQNSYNKLFEEELANRQLFKYPPFCRLLKISFLHKEEHVVEKASRDMAFVLRQNYPDNILGPEYPMISRIKNLYIKEILVKITPNISIPHIKKEIKETSNKIKEKKEYRQLRIQYNVDPL